MTVTKHPQQRVAIFIDTQNLYHSAKNLYGAKVNFKNLLEDAVAGRQLIRAKAYVVDTEGGEEQPFFEALEKLGIDIKTKDIQVFAGGAKKADWDVGLAIDAVTISQKIDAVVLATGDGDFVPLVKYLQAQECQVEVISFARSSSGMLIEAVDDFIDMGQDKRRYLIGNRRRNSNTKRKQSTRRNTTK